MKKKISLALTLVLILSTVFTVNVFALDVANIKEGTYIIQSKLGNNMVLDVYDASKESGANVQLYKKNNTSAQVFEIKKSGDYYTITPKCSGLKLDVKGGSTESGANVWQYKNNNSDSQKWRFYSAGNGYYYIRCKIGDKALDVAGGKATNGTNIQMYTLNQSDAQKWKLVQVTQSKKSNTTMTTSTAGLKMIKGFESFRSKAYKAVKSEKYYTIGYGHYGSDVKKGQTITRAKADSLFKSDIKKYENYVNSFLKKNNISVTQNQFDALVSFTYNLGNVWVTEPTFKLKTYLIKGIDNYSDKQIITAFTNWNKSGGVIVNGLTARRKKEAAYFLK